MTLHKCERRKTVSQSFSFYLLVVIESWRGLTLHALSTPPRCLLEEEVWHPHRHDDPFVLPAEVLVQQAIDDGIKATVEVSHEVAHHKEPLGDARRQYFRVDSNSEPNKVEWCPTNCKQHEHHKHGDKVPQVTGLDARANLWLYLPPYLDDQDPDTQVAEGDHSNGHKEMDDHHSDGVGRAGCLYKCAWIDAWVVLQRANKEVGHNGYDCQQPDECHQQQRVAVAVQLVVAEAVADVTVAVDGNACYVEDGANDTQAH